jgi:hypothetical protein
MSTAALPQPFWPRTNCYKCGVDFASPLIAARRDDGETFYCPNGHAQHFTETEAQRLRRRLESAERDTEWQRNRVRTIEKKLIAQRGQTTKARNKLARVHHGVCPECNRSFRQLAAHMKTKHGASA